MSWSVVQFWLEHLAQHPPNTEDLFFLFQFHAFTIYKPGYVTHTGIYLGGTRAGGGLMSRRKDKDNRRRERKCLWWLGIAPLQAGSSPHVSLSSGSCRPRPSSFRGGGRLLLWKGENSGLLFTFRAVKRRHYNRKYASFTLNAPGRVQGGRERCLFSVYSTDSPIEEFVLLRRFYGCGGI